MQCSCSCGLPVGDLYERDSCTTLQVEGQWKSYIFEAYCQFSMPAAPNKGAHEVLDLASI